MLQIIDAIVIRAFVQIRRKRLSRAHTEQFSVPMRALVALHPVSAKYQSLDRAVQLQTKSS